MSQESHEYDFISTIRSIGWLEKFTSNLRSWRIALSEALGR